MVYQYNVPDDHPGEDVKVKDLLKGFRDDTSAHGIPHVSNAPGKFKKIFWLVISLAACGVLIFHLYTVITTFLKFSTTVKVSLLQEHETDFPAVTVCNLNPIKRSALYLDSVLEELLADDSSKRKKRKRSVADDISNRKQYASDDHSKRKRSVEDDSLHRKQNAADGSLNRKQHAADGSLNRKQHAADGSLNRKQHAADGSLNRKKNAADGSLNRKKNAADVSLNRKKNAADGNRKKRYLDMTCTATQVYAATGLCYGVLDWVDTQDNARWECEDEDAGLYTPTSAAIESFVTSSIILDGVSFDKYWIYIKNDKWSDKVPVSSYTNYQAGSWQDAAAVDMTNGNQWLYYSRSSNAGILCQKMVSCPNPVYTMPDGSTVCWFMPWGEDEARWDRAKDSCGRYSTSAFMIELDTEAKYQFLVNDWGILDTLSGSRYWLNLKMDGGRDWQWSTQVVDNTWSNWDSANSQPDSNYKGTVADISNNHLWATLDENDDTITAMVICEVRGLLYNGYFSPNSATTRAATTIPDATTVVITTPSETTTKVITTPSETTTEAITTPSETTTDVITTPSETTTDVITTPSETTTVVITTPSETTTEAITTPSETTTEAITTPSETTTDVITTPSETTTVVITTQSETTTEAITSLADTTTQVPTTVPDTTTQIPTTVVDTTTNVPSTVVDTTTGADTTMHVVTTEATTTALPTTTQPSSIEGRPPLSEEFVLGETVIENLAILSEDTKTAMGYSPYEFILDCQYEGWICDVSHFYQIYDPIFGNCYLFNSGWNSSVGVEKSHRTGRRYGLSLVLNIAEDEYLSNIGGASGVRVVVHHQHSMPHPDEDGLLAKPGEVTSIGVQKILYKKKEYPYGDCTREKKNDKKDMYGDRYREVHYSKKNCYRTCYQRHVIDRCGCADSYYPMEGKALRLSGPVLPCDTNIREEDDCRYAVNQDYTRGKLGCHKKCPEACDEVYFDAELSTAVWPSSSHAPSILEKYEDQIPSIVTSNDTNALWKNLVSVEIFYNDFNYEKIQEIETYKFGQFLSDFGGILGLWVGCSVISIFEFFELGLDLIVLGCCGAMARCRKKQSNASSSSVTNNDRSSPHGNRRMSLRSVSSDDLRPHPDGKKYTSERRKSPDWSTAGSSTSSGFFDDFPATPSTRRSRVTDMTKKDNLSRMALRNKRKVGNIDTTLPSSPSQHDLYGDKEIVRTPRAVDVSHMEDIGSYAYLDSGSPPDWWIRQNKANSSPPAYSSVVGSNHTSANKSHKLNM